MTKMDGNDQLTIRHAQNRQPWTVTYSHAFREAGGYLMKHLYGSHTALHAAKSVGKIAAVFEALDHSNNPEPTAAQTQELRDMAADLMTAALRIANLYHFDLSNELERRVFEKNGVHLKDE